MDYFNLLSTQLSLELVSHVILLTLSGVLIMRAFGVGNICLDGTMRVSRSVLGGGLLFCVFTILSFFVNKGDSDTYIIFLTSFLLSIFGSYALLFLSIKKYFGRNLITAYYIAAMLFGVVYMVFALLEFTNTTLAIYFWYALSELFSTVSFFVFVHVYLTRAIHLDA